SSAAQQTEILRFYAVFDRIASGCTTVTLEAPMSIAIDFSSMFYGNVLRLAIKSARLSLPVFPRGISVLNCVPSGS
ncbi:MAG: hypothetical protein JXB38_04605, partial [Anaerolineales bacterium]|nr:hypothetical protein [Anaerolineales bacterium]